MKAIALSFFTLTSFFAFTSCEKDNVLSADSRPVLDSVINGGGAKFPNKVFIDLSAGRQTAVARSSWDLGFATGTTYNVILNSSLNMMAKAINKTDLNAVTTADTVGFAALMVVGNAATPAALSCIDYPDGDLSKTAIAAVSSTDADNKVYIVNRGADADGVARKWQKIRVLRNASGGYTLQYADLAATTYKELQVAKNANYNFTFVHIENGTAVNVEPEASKWDIAWTYFVNLTPLSATEYIPYGFQDFVLLNKTGVQAVQVMNTASLTYETCKLSDMAGLSFNSDVRTIGANWRSGGGPTSAPAIRSDRFYVVKDASGSYYKLKFTSLSKAGERGFPQLKFEALK